ncbi:MAG TPA: hypothetical protein VKP65_09710, partial [Rhodothermales bacterium]|nr:hypothetical protein [Rhodothermales bacterium]
FEDAAVLARCLQKAAIVQALQVYEVQRIRRASAITLESRRIGQVGQWEHPVSCWLRNRLIQSIPQPVHLKQLRATFQFEPGR